MSRIYSSLCELIGNTPLLRASRYARECRIDAELLLKLEMFNPLGSYADRVAFELIADAEEQGRLFPGMSVIAPTEGSLGVSLAYVCSQRGYTVVCVMPTPVESSFVKLIHTLGGKTVLTDRRRGMAYAVEKSREMSMGAKNICLINQFDSDMNPEAHRRTTGPEIVKDTEGNVDCFVACVGSSGSLTGIGEYLKAWVPNVEIIAVEPSESRVLSGGMSSPHGIFGAGVGFIPDNYNKYIVDRVISVNTGDALYASGLLAKTEGVIAGISSGAALAATTALIQSGGYDKKRFVIFMPDTGSRYMSSPIFSQEVQ